MNDLHPIAAQILRARGLEVLAPPPDMLANVGRIVRYDYPGGWLPRYGTITRDHVFRIIGVQKDFKGDLCYRVVCDAIGDTFGRCAYASEIKFVDS